MQHPNNPVKPFSEQSAISEKDRTLASPFIFVQKPFS